MSERSQAVNALIGAAVTIVLTFIPFSSVLGGGVAGYLEGGSFRDGVRVGTLSGLFAAVPALILFFFLGSIVSFGLMGMGGARMIAAGGVFVVFVFLAVLVYLIGLSALGGGVGAILKDERDAAVGPDRPAQSRK